MPLYSVLQVLGLSIVGAFAWWCLGVAVCAALDKTLTLTGHNSVNKLSTHQTAIWAWPVFLVVWLALVFFTVLATLAALIFTKDDEHWVEDDEIIEDCTFCGEPEDEHDGNFDHDFTDERLGPIAGIQLFDKP